MSYLQRFLILTIVLLSVAFDSARAQSTYYSLQTVAGQTRPTGDGGSASQAVLNRPAGLVADSAGNVYVADTYDYRVRKIDPAGKISTFAGNGVYGYNGDNGPAASASIGTPGALALDAAGNLYIADTDFQVVRKVLSDGTITTFAGNGVEGYSGTNGPATSASLDGPSGLAVDSSGNVYISETNNHRVMKVSGGVISVFAGNGVNSLTTQKGVATNLPLSSPAGLAFDTLGNLYVASVDYATIMMVTANGNMSLFAGYGYDGQSDGDGGPANQAHFLSPVALTFDAAGNLFVADDVAQVVRKINTGGIINAVAGTVYSVGFSGDGGSSVTSQLFDPSGLAVDKQGNLLVADYGNNRIRKIDPVALTINTIAGATTPLGDGAAASSAQLLAPSAAALDSLGNLYIADTANHRIRKVDSSGKISTVAGTGTPGFSGDGGPATSAQLLSPQGVAVDMSGNILVADTGNQRIRKIAATGNIATVVGVGKDDFAGDGGPATQAKLSSPGCIRLDLNNNLYIADVGNLRIRKVNAAGVISTVAGGNGIAYGDGGPATSALILPGGCMSIDSGNNLYIADTLQSSIRKVDSATGNISTIAGHNKIGFSGDGGLATGSQLFLPFDVVPDGQGNLIVADTGNARVRKIAANGTISTIAGTGLFGVSGDGGSAQGAQIGGISQIVPDPKGNLYLVDNYNNRVRLMTQQAAPSPDFSFTQDASSKNVSAGSTVSFSFTLGSSNGFAGTVTLSASGLTGGTVTFAPQSSVTLASGQTVVVTATVAISAGTAAGVQNLRVTAASGSVSHVLNETLTVTAGGPAAPVISAAGIGNAASGTGGAIAPGEIVTIYGANFGPATLVGPQLDASGKVATQVSGASATFSGVAAPIVYVAAGQMSVVVPYEVAGLSTASLQVIYSGVASNSVTVAVTDAAPGLFTLDSSGSGPLAAANQDNSINSASNPAAAGSIMTFYGTGEGQTSPGGVDGQLAAVVYPKPVLPVTATVGGRSAQVVYAGAAPGNVAGVLQVNLLIPDGIAPGSAVPVVITVGSKSSQTGGTVAIH